MWISSRFCKKLKSVKSSFLCCWERGLFGSFAAKVSYFQKNKIMEIFSIILLFILIYFYNIKKFCKHSRKSGFREIYSKQNAIVLTFAIWNIILVLLYISPTSRANGVFITSPEPNSSPNSSTYGLYVDEAPFSCCCQSQLSYILEV